MCPAMEAVIACQKIIFRGYLLSFDLLYLYCSVCSVNVFRQFNAGATPAGGRGDDDRWKTKQENQNLFSTILLSCSKKMYGCPEEKRGL